LVNKSEGARVSARLNKIDLIKTQKLCCPIHRALIPQAMGDFAEIIPNLAFTRSHIESLEQCHPILCACPGGRPECIPADFLTDHPERFMASEIGPRNLGGS